MKRTFIALVASVFSCLLLFAFAGCSDKVLFITDLEHYSDMQRQTDKIDVHFDNGTQEGFYFSITEKNEIEEVMEIIFSISVSNRIDPNFAAPDNTSITIYQGEKSYSLGVRFVDDNNSRYYFCTGGNLAEKLHNLATARGAFNVDYKLTVQDPYGYIIEPLRETYKAGENVTVKTTILYDVSMIAYLDGVSLGYETAVKTGDSYTHWEYYFIMPDHDAVLTFSLSGGM